VQLLAEGERKNEGNKDPNPERRTPGHPEMRYHVGFTCQLKIGHGDEHRTLRCLLDLSCIPPNKRNPDALWAAGAEGDEVDLVKFREFCRDHPRLVRRLREQIGADVRQKGFERPTEIVDFLAVNRDVPSLYQKPDAAGVVKLIEEETERFPVLPPGQEVEPGEADVFAVARAWYEYAQEPLPPETGEFGPGREPVEVKGKSRLPRMSQYIFRYYPARAQSYVAEELEKEGWFSPGVGKVAIVVSRERILFVEPPKDLTRPLVGASVAGSLASLLGQGPLLTAATEGLVPGRTAVAQDPDVVVVATDRLDAARAWRKAFDAFVVYARKNGLFADYPPLREARARRAVEAARAGLNSAAALDLKIGDIYVGQTNLVSFLSRADAEKHDGTLKARKKFYEADRKRKEDDNPRALALYREALDEWIDVMLRFPEFGQQSDVQEDIYELELAYLRLVQREKDRQLEPLLVGVAQAGWPEGFVDAVRTLSKRPVLPTRNVLGPLDLVHVYVGSSAETDDMRQLALAQLAVWPPVPLQKLVESDRDGQAQRRLLTAVRSRSPSPEQSKSKWLPLIADNTIIAVRQRYNLSLPSGVVVPNPAQALMMPPGGPPAAKRPPRPQ
jgi:hypothetical protein